MIGWHPKTARELLIKVTNTNKNNLIENSLAVFLYFGFNSALFSKKRLVFEVNLVLANIKK
jgi:hypothetical protein